MQQEEYNIDAYIKGALDMDLVEILMDIETQLEALKRRKLLNTTVEDKAAYNNALNFINFISYLAFVLQTGNLGAKVENNMRLIKPIIDSLVKKGQLIESETALFPTFAPKKQFSCKGIFKTKINEANAWVEVWESPHDEYIIRFIPGTILEVINSFGTRDFGVSVFNKDEVEYKLRGRLTPEIAKQIWDDVSKRLDNPDKLTEQDKELFKHQLDSN